jgi:putative tricarboxylic transport membrane protein
MAQDRANLFAAGALALFGSYIIWVAARLPYVSDVGPGPGFFPLWLGIGIIAFSGALLFSSRAGSGAPAAKPAGRAIAGWLALIAAIALVGRVGFLLSFVALTLFLLTGVDRRPALLGLTVALGLAIVFQLVFVAALDVPLPKGPWGF